MKKFVLYLLSFLMSKPTIKKADPPILIIPKESIGFRKAIVRISQLWAADFLEDGSPLTCLHPDRYTHLSTRGYTQIAIISEDFSQKRVGDSYQFGVVRLVFSLKDKKWEIRIGETQRLIGLASETEVESFIMNLWYSDEILTVQEVK